MSSELVELPRVAAVIMAVRNANRRWLKDAIASVRRQRRLKGWAYTLELGVDACEATSSMLLELGEPHWFSSSHVGPYVMRNTLMQAPPADAFAVFDADDVMHREYLKTLIPLAEKWGIAGAARRTIGPDDRVLTRRSVYGSGVAVFSRRALEQLGGYKSWINGADWDLAQRADALGITRRSHPEVLYDRRRHPGSLHITVGKERRDAAVRSAAADLERGILHVTPQTTDLERRA